jgi:hypothetical protein
MSRILLFAVLCIIFGLIVPSLALSEGEKTALQSILDSYPLLVNSGWSHNVSNACSKTGMGFLCDPEGHIYWMYEDPHSFLDPLKFCLC